MLLKTNRTGQSLVSVHSSPSAFRTHYLSANVTLLTRLAAASFSVFSNSFPSKLSAFAADTGTSKLKQNDMMSDSNLLSKAEVEKLGETRLRRGPHGEKTSVVV